MAFLLAFTVSSVLLVLYIAYQWLKKELWVVFGPLSANIFAASSQRPPQPTEKDQDKRDKVLKQGFRSDQVPSDLDAIIIGSGIGGLTTGALLSRAGRKVLVLEQHDRAGGSCHTFVEKGYEFDTGIHYIGDMNAGSSLRFMMDELTEGQLQWAPLNNTYDVVALGDPSEARRVPIVQGKKEQVEMLVKQFPEEEEAIRKFYQKMSVVRRMGLALGFLKLLPLWCSKLLIWTGVFTWMFPFFKDWRKTVQQVMDELTDNNDLKVVMSYDFMNYGEWPRHAPALMHFLLVNHYLGSGGYYPIGGGSQIPLLLIPVIERAGGRVMVRAPVREIVMDESGQRVVGVAVQKGDKNITIRAPMVISNAGMNNTCRLLPQSVAMKHGLMKPLKEVGTSVSCVQVFVGLKGTAEELELPKGQNIWLWKNSDIAKVEDLFKEMNTNFDNFPVSFISFPSTKDPEWDSKYPGKTTCLAISCGNFSWFTDWDGTVTNKRGKDYEALKKDIGRVLWNDVVQMYPQLEDKVEYFDVATPLSYQYYLGGQLGEIYGLNHSVSRFNPVVLATLRPETPIAGLYLTGQDVATCGLVGGMLGGVLSTSAILKRNVLMDMMELRKKMKKRS